MLTITCDNCEKKIELPDEQTSGKVRCPHCGDINVVPDHAFQRPGTDTASARGLPPRGGPEVNVLEIRPSMFRSKPLTFVFLSFVTFGGFAAAGILAAMGQAPAAVACAAVALVAAVVFGIWRISKSTCKLTVTTRRTIETKGLLSKSTTEVLHEHITNLQISQTFLGRIMGVGTIGISSSAQDGIEIVMAGVAEPYKVRQTIDAYRNL